MRKVKGVDNPADLGTKHLKFDDIERHLSTIGFSFRDGRSNAVTGINVVMIEPDGPGTGAVLARTGCGTAAGPDCRNDRAVLSGSLGCEVMRPKITRKS